MAKTSKSSGPGFASGPTTVVRSLVRPGTVASTTVAAIARAAATGTIARAAASSTAEVAFVDRVVVAGKVNDRCRRFERCLLQAGR